MNAPTGYSLAPVDLQTAPEAVVEEFARLIRVINREAVPEDPPREIAVVVTRRRAKRPGSWSAAFAARDNAGAMVGYCGVGWEKDAPTNQHLRWTELLVHSDHRRRGLGRALLRSAVAACEGQRDDLAFMTWTTDRVPASEAFAHSIGGDPGLPSRTSQLDLRTVDRGQIARWAKIDAPGYRLEFAANVIPSTLVPAYMQAVRGMDDTPQGSLRMESFQTNEALIRKREQWLRDTGIQGWVIVAVHEPTGDGVGFTNVSYDPKEPHAVNQGGTAVLPAHRGHQLGMWMKAAMLERILREWPNARYVRTANAHVNEPMLAINTKLGFRFAWNSTLWQLDLAHARRI